MMPQIVSAEALGGYRLRVGYSDGFVAEWDHADLLNATGPIAAQLHDPASFAQVAVSDGAQVWPNGYDVCPVTLRRVLTGAGVAAA
jgi:hypothetical protein